ncbi:DUF6716 putative glycosyltransferase [Mannheimia haemolytica]|uniref:DUF6716 putative glycosyltransferase n=1 Tax=Mannheimia haemolytica TaxID=75985 RepID=UPI002DDD31F1|nr:DUF6716 putative glycosyltransferase [Mannheimia haemolytica]
MKTEREYVLEKLLELARSKPDYSVFLKTRLYGNEITVHKDQYPYAHLLRNKKIFLQILVYIMIPLKLLFRKWIFVYLSLQLLF